MKKVFSITLSLLIVATMFHISFAMHYCGGNEVTTKLSITGELANCGMETCENEIPPTGTNYTKHCCDDVVTFCVIDNNYTPSFSFVPESYQYNFQVFAIPLELSVKSQPDNNSFYSNVSPPWALMSTNVDLSNICVFRI
jgi:hypothetical protein